MERRDRPSLDACDKDAVGIVLVLLYEISRGLFGWDGDERDALIGRLEPNDLWLVLLAFRLTARMLAASLTLGLLLLFGSLAAGA